MDPTEKRTCVVSGGRKKVHTCLDDGSEMVEEYNLHTDELLVRRIRRVNALGGEGPWEYEVGEEPARSSAFEEEFMRESVGSPVLSRKDTTSHFQWRVRNLPYPKEIYSVQIEDDQIVIRTSNRKYFKRIPIPELGRAGISTALCANTLSWDHANNTLILSVEKPHPIVEIERNAALERKAAPLEKEGDVGCKQQ